MISCCRRGLVAAALLTAWVLTACQSMPSRASSTPPPRPTGVTATASTGATATVTAPTAARATATPSPFVQSTVIVTATQAVVVTPSAVAVGEAAIPSPPPRDLVDLQRRLKPVALPAAIPTMTTTPNYSVGTEQTFWVANQDAKNYFQMRARIVRKTDHAYWYLEDGVNLPANDVLAAASYFEDHTYRTEHSLFGSEWSPGIDGDVHLTILVGHVPGVGGYYSTADEYGRDVNPYSNQREMIYINVDSVRPGDSGFNSTVAHEFMHMIQFNVHRWQDSWIDEGSAELAAQTVTGSTSGTIRSFESKPETQLNAWAPDAASLPHYGAAYLFMRYVSEHYGGYQAIGKVIAEPDRSIASFQKFFQSLRPPTAFEQVYANWVAANALDDPSLDDGRYGYRSLRLTPAIAPGPAIGHNIDGTAHQFGTDYYTVKPSGPADLVFSGTPSMQLIGADPHDGSQEWWSNRGDSIDTQLTRPVDLRAVKSATLRFWTWYDIEQDFDYAYVEVSTDNGSTWHTLPATGTTTSNPNGQNYGYGLTGKSGGGKPDWVQESADLSPYAGRQILLRFEYVTDDAYNADGLALDDVEIPEIGFKDTTLTDDGWTAKGFVRIDNKWPERYLVEVLSTTSPYVRRLSLDAAQRGTLRLDGGQPVVVAIAGLAPLTTRTTSFELGLTSG